MTVVLLSGGLDSAVCLATVRAQGLGAIALTVDYGQRAMSEERLAAARLAEHYAVELRVTHVDLPLGTPLLGEGEVPKDRDPHAEGIAPTYVPGRNAILLSLAASLAESHGHEPLMLVVGANADDQEGYPDCRPEFFEAFEKVVDMRVYTPLIRSTKRDVVRLARKLGVPIETTWSCYDPVGGRACGGCDACQLRAEALAA